jgi:hypothetical protein
MIFLSPITILVVSGVVWAKRFVEKSRAKKAV